MTRRRYYTPLDEVTRNYEKNYDEVIKVKRRGDYEAILTEEQD